MAGEARGRPWGVGKPLLFQGKLPVSGVRRLILMLVIGVAPGLAAAQSNVVAPPPPPRAGTVGPEQLRDFSLGGTREQPREQAPEPAETTPTRPAPAVTTPVVRTPPQPSSERPTRTSPAEQATPQSRGAAPTRPAETATVALPPAPQPAEPTTQAPSFFPPATPAPLPPPGPIANDAPSPVAADEDSGWLGTLLPILAVLAALGAAAFWWLRRSRSEPAEQGFGQLAFAGAPATAPAPRPAPQPPVAAPAPSPAPRPASVGIVSSRLRAWLELEIGVRAAAMTEDELQLQVDIVLTNSGSAPAREIAVEALVLNAGPEQDAEIARFFGRPDADGHAPDVVPPLGQLALSTTLKMSRAAFREYAAGTGKVMVPVVALNAGYKAGSAQGRTSAAFLVGRSATQSDKLGPLPTDQGAKGFARIAARRLDAGLRR